MSGMIKPVTHRGRPAASRRTRNPAVAFPRGSARGGGGILCKGARDEYDSLFVSSYADEKQKKRQRQARERLRRCLSWGGLALVAFVALKSLSTSHNDDVVAAGLRGEGTDGTAKRISLEATPIVPAKVPPPAPPAPKSNSKMEKPPPPLCAYEGGLNGLPKFKVQDLKHAGNVVCGREIPVDLNDRSSWPTPHTLTHVKADGAKHYALMDNDNGAAFGDIGAQLSAFFHAYDKALDEGLPLHVTHDSWAMKALLSLFFGPEPSLGKDNMLWSHVQDSLGIEVIESEGAISDRGMSPKYQPSNELFYYRTTKLDAKKIRDHRNTVLRNLFRRPAELGEFNVCSSAKMASYSSDGSHSKKYSVIHLASQEDMKWTSKYVESTKRNPGAALHLSADVANDILGKHGLWKEDTYLIDGETWAVAREGSQEWAKMKGVANLKELPKEVTSCVGSTIYLAVLADAYIGSPVSHISLWIARMRYALGMKNTFVMLEQKGNLSWESYLDDDYLDLYQNLGLWTP